MADFNHILNWKLLSGSHKFPGSDGGTCINEAAIIAAGFEYREVLSADDCPPCFSRMIATYAIRLNDSMPDDLRQKLLMPFVIRLAGTADPANEQRRAEYLAVETIRQILPIVCRAINREDLAKRCEAADNLATARAAADAADAAARAAEQEQIFTIATEIFDGAIKLGKQSDSLDIITVQQRMNAVRQLEKV